MRVSYIPVRRKIYYQLGGMAQVPPPLAMPLQHGHLPLRQWLIDSLNIDCRVAQLLINVAIASDKLQKCFRSRLAYRSIYWIDNWLVILQIPIIIIRVRCWCCNIQRLIPNICPVIFPGYMIFESIFCWREMAALSTLVSRGVFRWPVCSWTTNSWPGLNIEAINFSNTLF